MIYCIVYSHILGFYCAKKCWCFCSVSMARILVGTIEVRVLRRIYWQLTNSRFYVCDVGTKENQSSKQSLNSMKLETIW